MLIGNEFVMSSANVFKEGTFLERNSRLRTSYFSNLLTSSLVTQT